MILVFLLFFCSPAWTAVDVSLLKTLTQALGSYVSNPHNMMPVALSKLANKRFDELYRIAELDPEAASDFFLADSQLEILGSMVSRDVLERRFHSTNASYFVPVVIGTGQPARDRAIQLWDPQDGKRLGAPIRTLVFGGGYALDSFRGAVFGHFLHPDLVILDHTRIDPSSIRLLPSTSFASQHRRGPYTPSTLPCARNAVCPESAGMELQRRSTVRVRGCSGVILNNVRQDRTPYVLTAQHCGTEVLNDYVSDLLVRTNWESDTCANPVDTPSPQTRQGATVVAIASNPDFKLYLMDEPFPEEWELVYAGWSLSTSPGTAPPINFAHPKWDIKKVLSSDTAYGRTTSSWSGGFNRGVVEQCSSGSPVFDTSSGHLFGILVSGWFDQLECSADGGQSNGPFVQGPNMLAMFDAPDGMRPFLDPDNTGVTELGFLVDVSPVVCDPVCENGGDCQVGNTCDCGGTGYSGPRCRDPVCSSPCLHGTCDAPNDCNCDGTGYTGDQCENPVCSQTCLHGTCAAPDDCDCTGSGYTGNRCQTAVCLPDCVHGVCAEPDVCNCEGTGYIGPLCDEEEPTHLCSQDCVHGACVAIETCTCDSGWMGAWCDVEEPEEEPSPTPTPPGALNIGEIAGIVSGVVGLVVGVVGVVIVIVVVMLCCVRKRRMEKVRKVRIGDEMDENLGKNEELESDDGDGSVPSRPNRRNRSWSKPKLVRPDPPSSPMRQQLFVPLKKPMQPSPSSYPSTPPVRSFVSPSAFASRSPPPPPARPAVPVRSLARPCPPPRQPRASNPWNRGRPRARLRGNPRGRAPPPPPVRPGLRGRAPPAPRGRPRGRGRGRLRGRVRGRGRGRGRPRASGRVRRPPPSRPNRYRYLPSGTASPTGNGGVRRKKWD